MKRLLTWLFTVVTTVSITYSNTLPLIPYPQQVQVTKGNLCIPDNITLMGEAPDSPTIGYIRQELCSMGLNANITTSSSQPFLKLQLNKHIKGSEAYHLDVCKEGIRIQASTAQGLFYGFQTLRQLVDTSNKTLPCVAIKDEPAFSWRAFMLDEARHFKGKETVKRLLDEMAELKMNVFHWHLTDDQGWRIEIKKYPLLTEIGSKRDSTQTGGNSQSKSYRIEPHSGYYTQAEIADIIAYAQKRHITIVPEIEMPGHASAAIAAYQWLGTETTPGYVQAKFGVFENVYNVTDSRVRNFFEDVLSEVIDLFPGKVIHIGGDEVRYNQWLASPQVQSFMKEHKMSDPAEVQIWFTNNISEFIASKGRRMMGWNEITGDKVHSDVPASDGKLDTQLAKNAIVHFWKGDPDLIRKAVERGHLVVNSFHSYTYLDYTYQNLPLEKSYSFRPIAESIPKKYHKQIIGLGAQMWSEWIPTETDMYKQIFPRLAAYAECGWTKQENKSWERFKTISDTRWVNENTK